TSFIGREREIAEVKRLLGQAVGCQPSAVRETKPVPTDCRRLRADGPGLLTLTGAGGCGKTRLALQVAADLVEQYRDGVWLVELASLSDPGLVPQTVAATLGVREEPGRPLPETLADAMRPRSLLLVLDNCEHLLPACAQLV